MKKYAEEVCGGIDNVKQMFCSELRRKRKEKGLTPEELDRILNFGPEWPAIRELEREPSLFTHEFQQRLAILSFDGSEEQCEKAFVLCGDEINERISGYLNDSEKIEEAVGEFKSTTVFIHGTIRMTDPDDYVRMVSEGGGSREFKINMLPPIFYASMHIFSSIMNELRESDECHMT